MSGEPYSNYPPGVSLREIGVEPDELDEEAPEEEADDQE